jgi:hypothetical protein
MRLLLLLLATAPLVAGAPARGEEPAAGGRPVMRQLPEVVAREAPPSDRELVDARAEFNGRYPGLLARSRTTAGAQVIADALIEAAVAEEDRALKWFMLEEARRIAAASGNAVALDRAIVLASATYEFDAVEEEYRELKEIPLRALPPQRAAALAEVAEKVASRAEGDGRRDLAISAQNLAVRAWQRAGLIDSARRAAIRHDDMIVPE